MSKTCRKAVIPAAGLGTRFLPVTKAVPKELLPIGTKPTLQFVLEELVESGVNEVIIITSRNKHEIKDYFMRDTPYDQELKARNKEGLLTEFRRLTDKIDLKWVYQDKPQGLGHAIHCAKEAVAGETFIVCLPDIIIESKTPCCLQMIKAYEKVGEAINATEHTPMDKIHLYGVYEIAESKGDRLHKAKRVVEKPQADAAPSDLSVVGRYLFPADIFKILENLPPGHGGEIQLADAMNTLAQEGRMYAYEYEGRQFDTGDNLGFLMANIYYGYQTYPEELGKFMKQVIS